jgi:hypothetical protein
MELVSHAGLGGSLAPPLVSRASLRIAVLAFASTALADSLNGGRGIRAPKRRAVLAAREPAHNAFDWWSAFARRASTLNGINSAGDGKPDMSLRYRTSGPCVLKHASRFDPGSRSCDTQRPIGL